MKRKGFLASSVRYLPRSHTFLLATLRRNKKTSTAEPLTRREPRHHTPLIQIQTLKCTSALTLWSFRFKFRCLRITLFHRGRTLSLILCKCLWTPDVKSMCTKSVNDVTSGSKDQKRSFYWGRRALTRFKYEDEHWWWAPCIEEVVPRFMDITLGDPGRSEAHWCGS